MRLQKVQEALNTKKIPFEYTEEDESGCELRISQTQ